MHAHKHSSQRRHRHFRRRKSSDPNDTTLPVQSVVDIDPEDPTQRLDEAGGFHIEELDVAAQPRDEVEASLEAAVASDEDEEAAEDLDTPSETTADAIEEAQGEKDTGDLYGVHVPSAPDATIGPMQTQTDTGEHLFEAMSASATENGAAPEHVVDVTDDSDHEHPAHHKTDTRDRPVADKGSGGPGGL